MSVDEHASPGPQTEQQDLRAEVERIVTLADAAEYRRQAETFLARHRGLWRRIAAHLCRANSVRRTDYLDDVESHVMVAAWEMLEAARQDAGLLGSMRSFPAVVHFHARPRVRSFLDRATAPASGMVGAQRRRRELQRTRAELAALRGREPTTAEVVDTTNERLAATRKDPARQGMVVSRSDALALRGALSFDETLDSQQPARTEPDFVLHPVEGRELVASVVRAARAEDRTLGQVAALWLGEAYASGPPDRDTVRWIAGRLGLTRRQTLRHVERVRRLGVTHLAGIGVGAAEHRRPA